MKKSEFKKELVKENKSLKNFRIVGAIVIAIYLIMLIAVNILYVNNFITVDLYLSIMLIMIIAIVIPTVVIDVQNDIQIKKLYKEYKEENKKGQYQDKSGGLKIILAIEVVLIVLFGAYIATDIYKNSKFDIETKEDNEIISNVTNEKETKLVNISEYSINVPIEFEVMSEEMKNLKYPNGNPPTIVYTNLNGTVNVACNDNSIEMEDSELEEYVELFKSLIEESTSDMEINYAEKNEHKFASIQFISQAVDTEIYNHMILFTLDGYLRIVSFNCTPEYIEEWQGYSNSLIDMITF